MTVTEKERVEGRQIIKKIYNAWKTSQILVNTWMYKFKMLSKFQVG